MITMANRIGVAAALACAVGVSADPLNLEPDFPLLSFNNQGVTSYTAADDMFVVSATPLAVRFSDSTPPRFISPDAGFGFRDVTMMVLIGDDGSLIGGVPGPDLVIVGQVDEDGDTVPDYDGVLLEGEVSEFSCLDSSPAPIGVGTPPKGLSGNMGGFTRGIASGFETELGLLAVTLYEFRFTPTGGSLLSLYGGDDIGLAVTSENSTFTGDFTVDFGGGAKGLAGPIDPIPTGACCLPDGSCDELTEGECAAATGSYQGDGVLCDDVSGFIYDREKGEFSQGNSAGTVESFTATYNPNSERFTFEATFSDGSNQCKPNGFTMVINNGPNPKNIPGELAIVYADFSDIAVAGPVLTAYVYNGENNDSSFNDGDGNGAAPDTIISSLNDAFVNSFTNTDNGDGTCTLGFDIDVTAINSHVPIFPGVDPYRGMMFDNSAGIWLHPKVIDDIAYNGAGFLSLFDDSKSGFVDTTNDITDGFGCVPDARLALHFNFDEQGGTTVQDVIGGGVLGFQEDGGTITWVNDPTYGTGIDFDQGAAGNTIVRTSVAGDCDALLDEFLQTDAITIQVMFRVDERTNDARLVSWSSSTSITDRNFSLIADGYDGDSDNRPSAKTRLRVGQGEVEEHSSDVFEVGQVHVYTITYDGVNDDTLRVYVDGSLYETETGFDGGLNLFSSRNMMLGNEISLGRPFDGVLFDVKVWNHALTSGEVSDAAIEAFSGE